MTVVDPQTATLTGTVEETLQSLRGGYHHLPPKTETVLAEKLVEALTPVLAAQRAAVLREAVVELSVLLAEEHEAGAIVDRLSEIADEAQRKAEGAR